MTDLREEDPKGLFCTLAGVGLQLSSGRKVAYGGLKCTEDYVEVSERERRHVTETATIFCRRGHE